MLRGGGVLMVLWLLGPENIVAQTTSSYQRQPATPDLPLDHPGGGWSTAHALGIAQQRPSDWDGPDAPLQQVHLTIGSQDSRYAAVDWASTPRFGGVNASTHALLTASGCDALSAVGGDGAALAVAADVLQSTVLYRTAGSELRHSSYKRAAGAFSCYTSTLEGQEYASPLLHSVTFGPLEPGTKYFYSVGSDSAGYSPELSFTAPPPVGPTSFPLRLGLIGDLGQTRNSEATIRHAIASTPDAVLLVGDLSYADDEQPRWDSYARLVQPLAARVPVLVIEGNHEIERYGEDARGLASPERFTAYLKRYSTPQGTSGSKLYYSLDLGPAHVVMLGCYTDYAKHSEQWRWLKHDLKRVDRRRTPWLIVGLHAPWYNSNEAHQGEMEDMRQAMEKKLHKAGADIVFSGHVHAYERSHRVYKGRPHECGAYHITIGDGGNREGPSLDWQHPQPEWSAFREASYGHGVFDLVNATHGRWAWHRNDDGVAEEADALWVVRPDPQRCPCKHCWGGDAEEEDGDGESGDELGDSLDLAAGEREPHMTSSAVAAEADNSGAANALHELHDVAAGVWTALGRRGSAGAASR